MKLGKAARAKELKQPRLPPAGSPTRVRTRHRRRSAPSRTPSLPRTDPHVLCAIHRGVAPLYAPRAPSPLPPREARSDLIAGWVPDAATTSHLPAPLPSAARRRISPCSLSFYTGARLARRRESSSACGRPRSGHPVAGLVQEPSGGDEGKVGRPRAHRLHFHPPWSPLWLLD